MDTVEIIFVLMAGLQVAVWRWLTVRGVIALSWRTALMLAAINSVIIVLHRITQDDPYTLAGWFLNANFEYNLNSTVSSLYLLSIGIMALLIAARLIPRQQVRQGLVWLAWGAAYIFLSYDETFMFHESIRSWKLYFAGLGAALVLLALYAAWFADRANWRIYALLVGGLGITAAGGIGLDDTVKNATLVEELAELTGTMTVLAATFTYLVRLPGVQWRPVRRLLAAANTGWVVVTVLSAFWPLPALEARFLARPISASYLDGALSLIAYQVDERAYRPGDAVKVTTYWRANQPLPENYAQSVRLLAPPGGEPVRQSDLLLGPPVQPSTMVWPPGFVFRKVIYLNTEAALASPVSYWLSLNVWRAPWDDSRDDNMLLVHDTDYPLLLPDTLLLARLLFLSPEPVPPAPSGAHYEFDNGICLCGYELPSDSAGQPLRFWWQARADVDQELVQFLHLHRQGSDEVLVMDRPPLADIVPTVDWLSGLQAIGEWNVQALEGLTSGHYEVFTGLYERDSLTRIPVRAADDSPVLDNRIYLGTLVVE